MKGQFEISDEIISCLGLNLGELTQICIGQQIKNQNHNFGWFARRKTPFGTTQYLWDASFGFKISDKKYINYLLLLQEDGWELAYNIVKNK